MKLLVIDHHYAHPSPWSFTSGSGFNTTSHIFCVFQNKFYSYLPYLQVYNNNYTNATMLYTRLYKFIHTNGSHGPPHFATFYNI